MAAVCSCSRAIRETAGVGDDRLTRRVRIRRAGAGASAVAASV